MNAFDQSMDSPALAFKQVTKRFGSKIALADFTLDVTPGESFALVGMNGAGKTTLLKCLLDFCEPDSGSISIFGVTHRTTQSRSRLSFLPERFTPPYYLTGRDFLRYMLELQSVAYRDEDALSTLELLDLDRAALHLPVRAYSKGMTQKLGLAACLMSGKDLYVFDEPTSGLDPKARALLKLRLRSLRERKKTVFFTSHSLADVEEIGDRLAVLHLGEIRFVGGPEELKIRHHTDSLEEAYLRCIDAEFTTVSPGQC
jgi:ABC-2 type transport system ATP-binding protein